ncbi:S8 family serine peptidase [Microvirga aerophila]|uniref:Protease n=2 Tax=Microvirga aerophila TaxID=670291 RepID=A0A512C594_9HYPH|nr:S8 family serine peptidase [Microvirga aerophila]GEO19330.1 protease [Microvirga aerophila]
MPRPANAASQAKALQAQATASAVDPRPKPRQAPNSILASGLSREALTRLTAQGFHIETQTQGSIAPQIVRLRVPQGTSLTQARQRVRLLDARASTDFDHFYYLDEGAVACVGAECQAASLVNWSSSDAAQCGPTPLIGLIDTGINLEHEALKDQAIEVVPRPASHADASLRDHGTAVAALLVGRPDSQTPGLLPQAKIIAVEAFYRDGGTADRTDVLSLVDAIEALAKRGVQVMNMSLSGPANELLQKAIEAAQAKGIVLIAAVGNNGAGAQPSYPAAYPGVVAVTAVDQDLKVYRRATQGAYVDLSAPGVKVWTASAQGSGALRTGTSYAVPFVSAAAGLLLASNPELDTKGVQSRLEEHTRDLGKSGWDPTFGFGLIQMAGLCAQPAEPTSISRAKRRPGAPPFKAQTSDMP